MKHVELETTNRIDRGSTLPLGAPAVGIAGGFQNAKSINAHRERPTINHVHHVLWFQGFGLISNYTINFSNEVVYNIESQSQSLQ